MGTFEREPAGVILDARRVAELQYFLMDAAKRYVSPSGATAAAEDVLASAAALDYVLLIASQHAEEILGDGSATAVSVRSTMARAASAALDTVAAMLRAPDEAFDDFVERHVRRSCIFQLMREFFERGVIRSDDVAFRSLTLASEILERRCRSR